MQTEVYTSEVTSMVITNSMRQNRQEEQKYKHDILNHK